MAMKTMRNDQAVSKRQYFLRYLAVFSIPVLLLGSLLWANNLWYTYRETAALRVTTLSQMVESLDLLIDQTQTVADKASAIRDITAARRGQADAYQQISQWLGMYEDLFVEDVTLAYYLLADTEIITREGTMPYSAFENAYAGAKSLSLAGFFSTLNQSTRFSTRNLYREEGAHYALAFTYPIINQQATHVGTLAFLVPHTALTSTFVRYFPEESAALYIFDALNAPVYTGGESPARVRALTRYGGIGLVNQSDGNILLRAVSKQGKFTYYMRMPHAAFYAGASTDMAFLFVLQAVLVLFSAAVAISLTRNHYAKLQTIQHSNLTLKNELVEQDDIIRDLVLRKLLDGGRKDAEEIAYNLRCANIQYYHQGFFVLAAGFTSPAEEDMDSAQFAALFEGKHSPDSYYQFVGRPEHNQAVVIVNTAHDQEALREEVVGLLAVQADRPPVGISGRHESYLALNNAYVEAVVAVNERLHPQADGLYLFADIPEDARESTLPTLERSLIQESVRSDNRELVLRSVNAMFDRILTETLHPRIATLACYDVVNLCVRLYSLFDVPLSARRIGALSDFVSPQALREAVGHLLCDLCAAVRDKTSRTIASTKYNLIGFVQEHFRDSNLSLSLLADEFHLSQSYISKLFKDETGQTFVSYVRQLRLSYVKKQLMETDKQVKDIILDTGYVDVANFVRTFRQEEGVTPLQYRRNIRQNG